MLRQVPLGDLGPVDFMPQAIVHRSVGYFSVVLGFKFERDTDDLDDYESAFFKLDEQFPFALVHYRGNPMDTITIYFGRATKREDVWSIVSRIVDNFKLPSSAIEWISSE
jgi:hypothetical protein